MPRAGDVASLQGGVNSSSLEVLAALALSEEEYNLASSCGIDIDGTGNIYCLGELWLVHMATRQRLGPPISILNFASDIEGADICTFEQDWDELDKLHQDVVLYGLTYRLILDTLP